MKLKILIFGLLVTHFAGAQPFTSQDSLRGSITPEREWWNLTYYYLDIEVKPDQKYIEGNVLVQYEVLKSHDVLQIDLQSPLKITAVEQDGKMLELTSDGNAHFIQLEEPQTIGSTQTLTISYKGQPQEALNAPWDGGYSWKKDKKGNHFVATSCQGLGASVWWPCKDHMYDEVDSLRISVEVPENLIDVSNGRLEKVESNEEKSTKTYHWFVNNAINNYGVNVNIGDYVSWKETFSGEKGDLDITYWALRQNEKKAKKQFQQVPKMLEALEHWFGPYPFYEDGYQLVEAPYLGMEHQSSITYGNGYQNGYLGRDLSRTGWGLKFDFIIIHESGHEWFANNVTHRDAADMWIHEGFTSYSESLYLDYHFGKAAGQAYVRGLRRNIANLDPVIGPYEVNYEHPTSDIYYKGANILNMIRQIINDDEKWRGILRGISETFYHQTVTSKQIENYIIQASGINLKPLFDQYLRTAQLPVLEYYFQDGQMHYAFTNCLPNFTMPVDLLINGQSKRLTINARWQQMDLEKLESIEIDPDFYLGLMKSR